MKSDNIRIAVMLILVVLTVALIVIGVFCEINKSEDLKAKIETENGITYIYEIDNGNVTVKGNGNSVVYEY